MGKRVVYEWEPQHSNGEQAEITVGQDPVGYGENSPESVWLRLGNVAMGMETPEEVENVVADLRAAARILKRRIAKTGGDRDGAWPAARRDIDGHRHILSHALGLTRSKTAYRNHFAAEPGSGDYGVCRELVDLGFMVTTRLPSVDQPCQTFAVTESGREWLLAAVAALEARGDK